MRSLTLSGSMCHLCIIVQSYVVASFIGFIVECIVMACLFICCRCYEALSFPGQDYDNLETTGKKNILWLIGDTNLPVQTRNKESYHHMEEKTRTNRIPQ